MMIEEKRKELPFKIREKWLRLLCERCEHAYEEYGCGSPLLGEEYRKDCLYWTRKLRGKIEPCDSFDKAFRTAFDKMRSFTWYGSPTVNAWELTHYIMNALSWSLSEVESEISKIASERGIFDFPGSPPFGEDRLQKIKVGSIYGRSGYLTWKSYPKIRKYGENYD